MITFLTALVCHIAATFGEGMDGDAVKLILGAGAIETIAEFGLIGFVTIRRIHGRKQREKEA